MFAMKKALLILLGSSFCVGAFAAKVSVKLTDPNFSIAPADDLVYQGKRIDSAQAMELKASGVNLSRLNPYKSNLWSDTSLKGNNQDQLGYPAETSALKFVEFKASPSEIFRATVKNGEERLVLTASLDNHTNILRAVLLRLLGYDVDTPKFYKNLKIAFDSSEEKNKFIELVGEQTLTNRERWIKENPEGKALIVKGFTLEPAQLRNVNIYLPVMSRSRQASRRVFRGLLNLYTVTDFQQSVNSISWEPGREFNGSLIFNHPYASEFSSVTIEDMRWMQRRLLQLSVQDYQNAMAATGLPEDIQALLTQKLFSRVNNLSKLLRLENPQLYPVDKNITQGSVNHGKLTRDAYRDDYVVEFYKEDEVSPYRFWELFRLFKTQMTYTAISGILDTAMEKFIPGLKMDDAIENIQTQISDFRQDNQGQGVLPLKAFVQPLATGRGFANRNVVFGQYLGSNAPIQLVDSIGAEVNLGAFSNITGVSEKVIPSATATVSLGRTFTHVRAMPDLQSATSQEVSKILIPRHFKSLGKVIQDEYDCGVPKEPYSEETEINGEKVLYVKYDPSWENGRQRAIEKRNEMIASGTKESILLVTIEREKLCEEEISETRKDHLEEFLKQFALNEMFIVNDTVRLGARLNAPIPLTQLGSVSMNLSLTGESSVALLRSVMVRKTETGLEVTIQSQKDVKGSLSQGLTYFVELVQNSTAWTKGKLYSKVYKIDLENIGEEDTEKALKALRALFVNNDRSLVEEQFAPIELDHDVQARLSTFRLLFFKSEKLNMTHEVEVVAPQKEGENFTLAQRTRNLFSASSMKRKGLDFYSFADRILSNLADFIGLGSGSNDPGKTLAGSSQKTNIVTESELTPNRPFNAVTKVELVWSGWSEQAWKMNSIFDQVENLYTGISEAPLINRSILNGVSKVKSFDVRSSIIVYPSAMKKIEELLLDEDEIGTLSLLRYLYGSKKWDRWCARAARYHSGSGMYLHRLASKETVCVPPKARTLAKLKRRGFPKDRIELTKLYNKIATIFFGNFDINKTLKFLGPKNFFATTRIVGFREFHPEGSLDYISNSVGSYDTKIGTGVFDTVATHLGISPYELRAMMYTPSM